MKIEFNDPVIFIKNIFINKENIIIALLSILFLLNIYILININLINKDLNIKITELGQDIQSSFDYLENKFELLIRLYN